LQDNCIYHPGTFKMIYKSNYVSGTVGNWTCCKSSNKDAPGCAKSQHKEDPNTTSILLLLNQMYNNKQQLLQQQQQQQQCQEDLSNVVPQQGILINLSDMSDGNNVNNKTDQLSEAENKKSKIKKHLVKDTDTLVGLALKYNVKVEAIKKLNRMATPDVQAYSQILIPPKNEELTEQDIKDAQLEEPDIKVTEEEKVLRQRRTLQMFRNKTGATFEEALYYVTLHGYSVTEAFKEYEEDVAWEKAHKASFSTSLGSF